MNLDLEIEFSKASILQEVNALKKQIDDMRPLPADVEGRVMQKLRLDWNYNSNAIEGNKLSYGETTALLMHGITAKGKPLKDHLDIKGHNSAVEYLENMVRDGRDFTQTDIRGLHEVILGKNYESPATTADGLPTKKEIQVGKYKSMPNHVQTITGEIHYYATPEETPAKMNDLMDWYNEAVVANINPVVIAALFHHRFVAIHPFDDGNGRMARILMNLILMRSGYPPVVVKQDDKQNYYSLLSQADTGSDWPFVEYISERLKSSLELYIKAINGGDVDEDEDIDKEIALLKIQLNGGVVAKEKKSDDAIQRIFGQSIYPLAIRLLQKSKNFYDYFFDNQKLINILYMGFGNWQTATYAIEEGAVNSDLIANYSGEPSPKIELKYIFKEYKDPLNNFTISISCNVNFEEFYYRISIKDETIISKLYHEDLTYQDLSKVLKRFIGEFKGILSENLKSPES